MVIHKFSIQTYTRTHKIAYGTMWSKPTAPLSSSPPNAEPLSPTTAVKQRNPGKRFAQIVKLKPEFIDKYKDVHAAVWPEVLKEIKNCNIVDCRSCYIVLCDSLSAMPEAELVQHVRIAHHVMAPVVIPDLPPTAFPTAHRCFPNTAPLYSDL